MVSIIETDLIDVVDGPRTRLGESPRWDGTVWWWVDALAGEVWTRRPGERAVLACRTGRRTSLVHPESSGRVVIACEQELLVLAAAGDDRWDVSGVWCDLGLGGGWLVNDGVADAAGRLWIGTIAPGRKPRGGALLRIDPDGTVTEAATGFTLTNGMAWDSDGTTLFHVDTFERTIWAHRVDVSTGQVEQSRPFLVLDADDGLPDGLATDTAGGVWVAMYARGEARRYTAQGALDHVVTVEPPQCTSIELGGPTGRDLLITTAREGYDDERSRAEPRAGRLYRALGPVPGVPRAKVVVAGEVTG